jgi:hypothetical protein
MSATSIDDVVSPKIPGNDFGSAERAFPEQFRRRGIASALQRE